MDDLRALAAVLNASGFPWVLTGGHALGALRVGSPVMMITRAPHRSQAGHFMGVWVDNDFDVSVVVPNGTAFKDVFLPFLRAHCPPKLICTRSGKIYNFHGVAPKTRVLNELSYPIGSRRAYAVLEPLRADRPRSNSKRALLAPPRWIAYGQGSGLVMPVARNEAYYESRHYGRGCDVLAYPTWLFQMAAAMRPSYHVEYRPAADDRNYSSAGVGFLTAAEIGAGLAACARWLHARGMPSFKACLPVAAPPNTSVAPGWTWQNRTRRGNATARRERVDAMMRGHPAAGVTWWW